MQFECGPKFPFSVLGYDHPRLWTLKRVERLLLYAPRGNLVEESFELWCIRSK